jgi:hypothetical protein
MARRRSNDRSYNSRSSKDVDSRSGPRRQDGEGEVLPRVGRPQAKNTVLTNSEARSLADNGEDDDVNDVG